MYDMRIRSTVQPPTCRAALSVSGESLGALTFRPQHMPRETIAVGSPPLQTPLVVLQTPLHSSLAVGDCEQEGILLAMPATSCLLKLFHFHSLSFVESNQAHPHLLEQHGDGETWCTSLTARANSWALAFSRAEACCNEVDHTMLLYPSRTGSRAKGPVFRNRCHAVSLGCCVLTVATMPL